MLLLQTIIPMPIYTSGGSSGPWTHEDTMLCVAILIGLAILQIITNLIAAAMFKVNFFKMFTIDRSHF